MVPLSDGAKLDNKDISKKEEKGSDGEIEIVPTYTRVGAEVIVKGKDESGATYVLFVNNTKSRGFFELPGGGFSRFPGAEGRGYSLDEYKSLIKHRLGLKAGLVRIDSAKKAAIYDTRRVTEPEELKIGGKPASLWLDETKVAQDSAIKWDWAYYKLFTATYLPEIAELDQVIDNAQIAKMPNMKIEGENGYLCALE